LDTISKTEVQVQQYLRSDLLALYDTHTLFILDVMQAVYAFTHCQDQLIVNDWDPDSDILLENPSPSVLISPYPIVGPRSEHVSELIDYRAHAQGTIAMVKDALPARILTKVI
jgi:hypothetical protein